MALWVVQFVHAHLFTLHISTSYHTAVTGSV